MHTGRGGIDNSRGWSLSTTISESLQTHLKLETISFLLPLEQITANLVGLKQSLFISLLTSLYFIQLWSQNTGKQQGQCL